MEEKFFTYSFYKDLIHQIKRNDYTITDYFDNCDKKRCILRHDIDFSIEKSLTFAKLEHELGVKSTYFVLLKTNFYNPLSKESISMLKEIISLGHDIGLHFDEKSYDENDNLVSKIVEEAKILSNQLNYELKVVSMHRPSTKSIDADFQIPNMVNSYSKYFFKSFKYISDSRKNWKENPFEIVESGKYNHLHILTHAFWYHDEETTIKSDIVSFINKSQDERIVFLKDNLRDFDDILK